MRIEHSACPSQKERPKNPVARRFALSFAVLSVCLSTGQPLSAQQGTPSLQQVLNEGLAACQALVKREKATKDLSFNGYVAQGLLTFAMLGSGQRQMVDDLFSDEADKRKIIALSEELLVETTGKLPEIKKGMPPFDEVLRRHSISMALAKRGDFKRASEQIAAFPEDEKASRMAIRGYQFLLERQLDKQDLAGARQTNRLLWSRISDLKDSRRKARWLTDLAKSTSRADEQGPAQKLCLMAEEMLQQFPPTKEEDPRDMSFALRELAFAHAMSGNANQARAVLAAYKQRVEAIKESRDKSERMSSMETAHARVANLSNRKEAALQAYARALEWASKINNDSVIAQGDALDESGFLSALISLGTGAEFRTIALGQLEAGDKPAALATLKRMPMCLQKPATLLEMAKRLHKQGATAEARQLAEQCAALERPKSTAEDHVVITAFVANIYRAIGDDAAARKAMKKLAVSQRVKDSLAAKKMVAAELTDFKLFDESYSAIQEIESPADRALVLAKLAESMVKAGRK